LPTYLACYIMNKLIITMVAVALLLWSSAAAEAGTPTSGGGAPAAALAPCSWCNMLGWTRPEHLRIYLAQLPEPFAINPKGNRHYPGVSQEHPFGLPVPAAASAAPSATYPTASAQLFDTYMFSAGQWWLRQARTSPLRVDSADAADVVLVPLATLKLMTWEAGGLDAVEEWYRRAPALLGPHLGRKPHVIVLSKGEYDFAASHAAPGGGNATAGRQGAAVRHGLVTHPGAARFTFLTHGFNPITRGRAASYIVGNMINVPFPTW
jgi:hypothetical protein